MKKYLILILILTLLFTFQIVYTYALFESNNTQELNSSLAKWNIKINDNIVTSDTTSFVINDVYVNSGSGNVATNKFAPGSKAYFDIIIDSMDSEVAIRYDISLNLEQLVNSEIKLESVSLNNQDLIMSDENVYTGIITLEDIENNDVKNIRVNLIWNNNEENNNIDYDTVSEGSGQLEIPVTINLSQYLGEEIIAING